MIEFAARYLEPARAARGDRDDRRGHRRRPEGVRRPAHLDLPGRTEIRRRSCASSPAAGSSSTTRSSRARRRPPSRSCTRASTCRRAAVGGADRRQRRCARRGWRLADRNVFGELATRQLLELGVEKPEAEAAAAGWDGDRYELWRRDVAPARLRVPVPGRARPGREVGASTRPPTPPRVRPGAVTSYLEDGLDGEPLSAGRLAGRRRIRWRLLSARERRRARLRARPRARP